MWVTYLNSAACIVLLFYLLPVALIMDNRRFWGHRLGLWVVAAALGVNAAAPFEPMLPTLPWDVAALHVCLVLMITLWRHEIWQFVRLTFSPHNPPSHRL